ncbi:DNA-binding MarR family transcriptional regulator [Novosphingobium hassiacum]|uniref:DNA-binding MarR family transcriptional regulator n=1 Tax=Novosphingobium hassiacum TaxID=173676 RepID=A0A7W5ZST4_9SPHN|nr:MarR family transcriptional regulator [Novosphingobium hassiacum]MBB3859358.1 DNA-binding MarR family transcriptional regulator [Novosphingobium hassiacum]
MQARSWEVRLWVSALSLQSELYARLNRTMTRECGLTLAKYDFLAQIYGLPQGLTLGDLTRKLKVTGGNVTGLAKRLVADGLITREMSATDRRSFIVTITRQGAVAFEAARARHDTLVHEWLHGLPGADLEQAVGVLEQVRGKLARTDASHAG